MQRSQIHILETLPLDQEAEKMDNTRGTIVNVLIERKILSSIFVNTQNPMRDLSV